MMNTKYDEVAQKMNEDYSKLLAMVIENGGKIPSKKFGKEYGVDASACRCMFIGIHSSRKYIQAIEKV